MELRGPKEGSEAEARCSHPDLGWKGFIEEEENKMIWKFEMNILAVNLMMGGGWKNDRTMGGEVDLKWNYDSVA